MTYNILPKQYTMQAKLLSKANVYMENPFKQVEFNNMFTFIQTLQYTTI